MRWTLRTPGQYCPVVVRQRKSGSHVYKLPPGREMGQKGRNWGGKRIAWIAGYLPCSTIITLPGKMPPLISISGIDICGGGRFQMAVIGERGVPTPEAATGIKESAWGVVAPLLADLARRGHRHPEMRPQTSPRKDKSTAHRATHSPATARKRSPKGRAGGAVKCLNRPVKPPPTGQAWGRRTGRMRGPRTGDEGGPLLPLPRGSLKFDGLRAALRRGRGHCRGWK